MTFADLSGASLEKYLDTTEILQATNRVELPSSDLLDVGSVVSFLRRHTRFNSEVFLATVKEVFISLLKKKEVRETSLCLGEFLSLCMRTYKDKKVPNIRRDANTSGKIFEALGYYALVSFGVPENCIRTNSVYRPLSLEIDVVVQHPTNRHATAIHFKTSFRERWQQADRTAIVLETADAGTKAKIRDGMNFPGSTKSISHWVVAFNEYPKTDSPEKAIKKIAARGKLCHSIPADQVLSCYDYAQMDKLLEECLETAEAL